MGSTNFLQHNPSAANQENDATYTSDSTRTGGIGVDQILASVWLNKVWFQSSTFVAAMAAVISSFGPGYTITDTTIATLQTNLLAFFNAFVNIPSSSLTFPGHIQIGPFVIQWGTTGSLGNDTPTSISFPIAFPTGCLAVVGTDTFAGSKSAVWSMYGWNTTNFTARCDGNTATATFLAVGY